MMMSTTKRMSKSDLNSSHHTVRTTATSTAASTASSLEFSLDGDNDNGFSYQPTSSKAAQDALHVLQERLADRLNGAPLTLDSMKESFDLEIITKFYDELMIPNFPLEEERDDLEDWLLYLDPSKADELSEDGPSMDVLILRQGTTILGGIAFEYYPQAHAGLLSYMVVSTNFRRLGILATLHPVFSHALQSLHEVCTCTTTPIRAILAETNTTTAGDVSPQVCRKRHEILYRLGYRLLQFPYVQPPLAPDVDSFDDIMLLVYVGSESQSPTISTKVLHNYVLDFYHSVFGFENVDFQDHWYYRLVTWYSDKYPSTTIQSDLPWEDVTPQMNQLMLQELEASSSA